MEEEKKEDQTGWGDEEFKNALSGRDKKITAQELELKELLEKFTELESLKGDKTDGNDNNSSKGDGENVNDLKESGLEDVPDSVIKLLETMQKKIDTLQKNSVDQLMNVDEALSNEDFVKWADSTKSQSWNPDSQTMGDIYSEYYEAGNTKGMKNIMISWDKYANEHNASPVNINHGRSVQSSKQRKAHEKADELYAKAKTAMKERRFKDALNYRNQASALMKG